MEKREKLCHRLGIIPQGSQQRMRQAHSWYWCGMISLAMACKFDLISAECIEIVICFCRCSPCYLTLDIYWLLQFIYFINPLSHRSNFYLGPYCPV